MFMENRGKCQDYTLLQILMTWNVYITICMFLFLYSVRVYIRILNKCKIFINFFDFHLTNEYTIYSI